jgi:SpoVK/Ycf46/Vps4 family AAA+-type ATPase
MLSKKDESTTSSRIYEQSKLFQAPKGVLLYGPPGCGKTLLAKALASESGARFINVPFSLIMSKWVGETEKYLEAVFSLAKKIKPAIIFIDEIDSLTKRRNEFDAAWNSTMKSQFLTLWDGLLSENDSEIVVLGATNRRQDIDEAFLRRMPLQIKINLPNPKQRENILRILLSDVPLSRSFSFASIVSQTEGMSGSDLKEICRRVIMNASTLSVSADTAYLHSTSFDQAISKFKSEISHDNHHYSL